MAKTKLERYTNAVVYLNSSLLSEQASVTIKRMSGAQPVKTVAKGLAGFSPGAAMMTVSVSNAVPSADFEYDAGKFIDGIEIVELTIFAAGRTLTSNGAILDDNFSAAVDTQSKLDFEFTGQMAQWQ